MKQSFVTLIGVFSAVLSIAQPANQSMKALINDDLQFAAQQYKLIGSSFARRFDAQEL